MRTILLFICLVASFSALAQETLEQIKENAATFSAQGLHEEALKYRMLKLKQEPSGLVYGQIGFELIYLDREEEAKSYLEKATTLTPLEPSHWVNLSMTYSNLKQYEEALQILNKALEINPDYEGSLAAKAKCLYKLNRYDESLPILNKLLESKKFELDLIFTRGKILLQKGELENARIDFTRALSVNPNHYGSLSGLAEALQKQENYPEEILIRKRIMELYTDNNESDLIGLSYALLGLAYNNAGEYENALSAFNFAIALEKSYAEVFIQRCIAKIQLKDLEGACADLSEAMRLKPEEASDMRDYFEEDPEFSEFLASCSPEL